MILTDIIGEPAMLEQLAEECNELAHAALKLARVERRENPTPVKRCRAVENLIEEMTDVMLNIAVLNTMGYCVDYDLMDAKLKRWNDRVVEARKEKVARGERIEF